MIENTESTTGYLKKKSWISVESVNVKLDNT